MNELVVESGVSLRGRAQVPGDKSISHRAVLLGALADGVAHIENFLPSGDCRASVGAVRALGIEIEKVTPTTLRVHGRGLGGLREPEAVIDCVRSGTTLRLLSGILAGQLFTSILSGDRQLLRRPVKRIIEPLRQMGATVLGRAGDRLPPLTIRGGGLRGIEYHLPVASAQLKSCLLLAALYAQGPTTLHEPGPGRDHTERMLQAMGARLDIDGPRCTLIPGHPLRAIDTVIPGDFSSAAFPLVAAVLTPGSEITLEGVGVNPTRTGLLDILRQMGAQIQEIHPRLVGGEPVADLIVRSAGLRGVEVGGTMVVRAIDEMPVWAVAATQAQGVTILRDAAELRVKETDRIATTVKELRRLGADIEALPDGFVVRGPTPLRLDRDPEGAVHSHGDHRLAMALVVAGLVAQGRTRVQDTAIVADSFPGFVALMQKLGAALESH